jgi:hypothetical protein
MCRLHLNDFSVTVGLSRVYLWITKSLNSAFNHAETEKQYGVEGILKKTRNRGLLEWTDYPLTQRRYEPTWVRGNYFRMLLGIKKQILQEPKENFNEALLEVWEQMDLR